MINCLTSQLTYFSSSIDCVTQLKMKLLAECKKRFGLIEFNPRFKNLHSQDAGACGKAIQKLKNMIKENMTVSTSGSEDETVNEDYDFRSHHKELAVGQKRKRSPKADEVSFYLDNPKNEIFLKILKLYMNGIASSIYNIDETGSTVQQTQKVIAIRGIKLVGIVTLAERGTLVSDCCISFTVDDSTKFFKYMHHFEKHAKPTPRQFFC
ncbi:hypothetical protein HHI36_022298 [Cryptolaemus montrouzieri]|uniref:Uncharacterized protein n=1 Tax=Cryptolaemus montrouzieri TaxID=559131 RepID=A0ABD2MZD1_9CUCU